MKINHCPACGSDRLSASGRPESVAFKGSQVRVQRMLATECAYCGYLFATPEQHDANVAAARSAHVKQRAAAKAAKGLLTGSELRAMREALGLNQKEAAELFGGGPVAFSKYENEDVAQSVAMDRLIRVIYSLGPGGLEALRAARSQPGLPGSAKLPAEPRVAGKSPFGARHKAQDAKVPRKGRAASRKAVGQAIA